jgi:hypothetical protein
MRLLKDAIPDSLKSRAQRPILDLNGDYRRSVFLAGVGRSGTTWLSSMLNYDNEFRDIFEPFHSHFVRPARRFVYSLYLRPDNKDRTYLDVARRILRGRIRNWWIDQANRRIIIDRRLIKEIRANLWLRWLKNNFPELPIVFLVRHPCSVVASQMALEWPTRLQQFLGQAELMDDHLLPFKERMLAARTAFERHMYVWCIQHYVPFQQFREGDIFLAYYENFVCYPEREFRRLFDYIRKPFRQEVLSSLELPSRTTRRVTVTRQDRNKSLEAWRHSIDREMLSRAMEILSEFGLDRLYGEETMPRMGPLLTS